MRNIKKISTQLAIFTLLGAFAMLSTGCEIAPYGYHEDDGYYGYHHRDWHRHRDDDHDFRSPWK